jgi:hypothetical protein
MTRTRTAHLWLLVLCCGGCSPQTPAAGPDYAHPIPNHASFGATQCATCHEAGSTITMTADQRPPPTHPAAPADCGGCHYSKDEALGDQSQWSPQK